MKQIYFIIKIECRWLFVDELQKYCWVESSTKKVSPDRLSYEESMIDFEKLGFRISPKATTQCNDKIIYGDKWIRYIIQRKSIF